MLATSMLAQAWQFADDSIPEHPAPADIGGFVVVLPRFHKIIANADGTYIEYETSGDLKYTPTGLLRIHLKDGHPQLGPSDGTGVGGSGCYLRPDSLAKENIAVGPAWKDEEGNWTRLAATKGTQPNVQILEQSPWCTKFVVTHHIGTDEGSPAVLTQTITVRPNDVCVDDVVKGENVPELRVYYPMLVFDGKEKTDINIAENRVRLQLDGENVSFEAVEPSDARLVRTGVELKHRNGLVEPVYFDADGGRASYRVFADK
jgi:hypothetical protein